MDGKFFTQIAKYLDEIELFPYINICHYILISIQIREIAPGNKTFSRQHPLASYVATMILCFSGSILSNLVIGEPLVIPLKYHENILHASICWYLVNYFPFDLVYSLTKFLPIYLSLSLAKELYRCRMIRIGVEVATRRFNDSILIWLILGLSKGCAEDIMMPFAECLLGRFSLHNLVILTPNFNIKGSLAVAFMFALEKLQKVPLVSNQLFLAALMFLTYFRISSLIVGIKDPFIPFENIVCGLFFGGLVDSIRNMSNPTMKSGASTTQNIPTKYSAANCSASSHKQVGPHGDEHEDSPDDEEQQHEEEDEEEARVSVEPENTSEQLIFESEDRKPASSFTKTKQRRHKHNSNN